MPKFRVALRIIYNAVTQISSQERNLNRIPTLDVLSANYGRC